MKKHFVQKNQGFTSFLSLLVIAILITSGYLVYNQRRPSAVLYKNVLSDTTEVNNGDSKNTTQNREQPEVKDTQEPVESPEPKESPEATEKPEPTETPEFQSETETSVKEGTTVSKIKIRSGINKFEFQQEGAKFSVQSSFPLSVNPVTRELTVTTPAGSRVVAVLPQQAVDNMLSVGLVSTTSAINLKTEDNGSLSYTIDGTKNEKILGVFDVAIPKNLIVSAQTGEVLVVNQSVFSRILDFLSI